MTNEIEQVRGDIKVLQARLELLEEIERYKSPVEEGYKSYYGVYPPTTPSVDNTADIQWRAFQYGWEESKYNCADISKVLIEGDDAYIMGEKYQKVKPLYEPLKYDEVECDEKDNPKSKTLYNLITRWWCDVFGGIHRDWDMETSIEDLCDRIELWNIRNKK